MKVLKATQIGEREILSKPANKRTPSRVRAFLEAYERCGSITGAARAAGISWRSHYYRLEKDSKYREVFERLQDGVAQEIEDAAVTRAKEGTKRLQLWRGKPIKVKNKLLYEVEWDTSLQALMLRRFRPKLYREHTAVEHSGSVNLVERLEQARARLLAIRREEEEKSAG